MGKNQESYLSSAGRYLSLFLYAQATVVSAEMGSRPSTPSSQALGCPARPSEIVPTHETNIHYFPPDSGVSLTWPELHERTRLQSDPAAGARHFDLAYQIIRDCKDSEKIKIAFKHFQYLVDFHAVREINRDHYKLKIPFHHEIYRFQKPDLSKTYFTDSEMILAAYQVATEQAKWIQKYGPKDLLNHAQKISHHLAGSNRREHFLIRYLEHLAVSITEEIKQTTVGSYPDYKEHFNLNPKVHAITSDMITEFFYGLDVKRQPIMKVINDLFIHILHDGYIQYFKDHKLHLSKECTAPDEKSEPSESSMAESLALVLGTMLGGAIGGAIATFYGMKHYFTPDPHHRQPRRPRY